MKKKISITILTLILFLTAFFTVNASLQTISFSNDSENKGYLRLSGNRLIVGGITDTDAVETIYLSLYNSDFRRSSYSATVSKTGASAEISIAGLPDGIYYVVLEYSGSESLKTQAYTPVTIKLQAKSGMLSFVPPSVLNENVSIKNQAENTPQELSYLAICSSSQGLIDLSLELTKSIDTDYEKARALYRWVIDNIYYDNTALLSEETNYGADEVLSSKTANGRGFSNLIAEMLRANGIPARIVKGISPVQGIDVWLDRISDNEVIEHYWAEAYIDGKWINLDAALDTANIYNGKYQRNVQNAVLYFDATDRFFAYTHYTQSYETVPLYLGYKEPDTVQAINGTDKTQKALGLPETVLVETTIGNYELAVEWNVRDSSYSVNKIEKQEFTVTGTVTLPYVFSYGQDLQQTVEINVIVNERKLVEVSVVEMPHRYVFLKGSKLDTDGLVLKLKYDNGKSENITGGFNIDADLNSVGNVTVKLTYENYLLEYTINVISDIPNKIELAEPLPKTVFYLNDSFDSKAVTLHLCYDMNYKEIIDDFTVEYDFSVSGNREIRFSYGDFFLVETVKVLDIKAESVIIVELPDKLIYNVGEELDPRGLLLKILYNNGTEEYIKNNLINNLVFDYDFSEKGEAMVVAAYEGASVSFIVTVLQEQGVSEQGVSEQGASEQGVSENGNDSSDTVSDFSDKPQQINGNGRAKLSVWELVSIIILSIATLLVVVVFVQKQVLYKQMKEFLRERKKK